MAYKTGWMKKIINGVSTKVFAFAHAKTVYTDYANGKTLDTTLDEKAPKDSPVFTGSVSMGRKANTTVGAGSTALGNDTAAAGNYAHAEGSNTNAFGNHAHAEGYDTDATGAASHAEGDRTTASGSQSHAEGSMTTAKGEASHAEGSSTNQCPSTIDSSNTNDEIISKWKTSKFSLAKGNGSHVEGIDCLALGDYSHAEGYRTKAVGEATHAEGISTNASAESSHAEGNDTKASGYGSHAEGNDTKASGDCSHAEGAYSISSGDSSHAEGMGTSAEGDFSHAEGYHATAYGQMSHAGGRYTKALGYQYAIGHHNNTATATASNPKGIGTGTSFVIGNGTYSCDDEGNETIVQSNAFRVNDNGQPFGQQAYTTQGCDYAEYYEWLDENKDAEDRRGYFVTLDGEKIKIANPGDFVLGIVSAWPSIIGNGDEDWLGRYILDNFGSRIPITFEYEEEEQETITNEEGEPEIVTKKVKKTGTHWKQNPDYDPNKPYTQRSERPEWDAIGMLGVLAVRDDGTCQVNGFCTLADGGIATASDKGYRVVKRVTDNIVKVIFSVYA